MSVAHPCSYTLATMSPASLPGHSSAPITPAEPAPLTGSSTLSTRPLRRSTRPSLQPSSFDDCHGSKGDAPAYSPSMLMPPPSSYPTYFLSSSDSPHMSSPLGPSDSPYWTQYSGSPSQFGAYPQPYPVYPQYGSVPMSHTISQQSTSASQSGLYTDTDADDDQFPIEFEFENDVATKHYPSLPAATVLGSPSKIKAQPPRPPNAWILYRSDRLKDISAGREVKGLDAVMRDSGFSGSSASSGEESGPGLGTNWTTPATSVSADADDEQPKAIVRRKGKKGAKEPTEGLLRMGSGKTGRGLPQAHISKMISELWKRESAEVRKEYESRSEKRKNEHAKMYPNYKFTPVKKADKVRAKEERDREKLAAKQQKAARASSNRGRKGTRSRPSTSTSPCSTVGGQGIARSVSYHGIHQKFLDLQELTDQQPRPKEEDRYSMRPFPVPMAAVPALPDTQSSESTSRKLYNPSRQPSPSKVPRVGYELQPVPSVQFAYPQHPTYYDQPASDTYTYQPLATGAYGHDNGYQQVYAQPVVFEPQDLPVDFGLDGLVQDYQETNPDDLIAEWVRIEEDTGDAANTSWQQDPNTVAASWGELSDEAQQQYFDELDLSLPMAVDFAPYLTESNLYTSEAYQQPTVDYSTGYIAYPYQTAGPLQAPDSGPFLSMAQPPSPDPNATTPRQATFARSHSNTYDVIPNDASTAPQMATRYVSSSAFPDTPLSVDPSGLGGNDRQVSYANAYLHENHEGDTESLWDGSVSSPIYEPASEPTTPAASLAKQTPQVANPEMPLSPISPSDSHLVTAAPLHSPSPRKDAGPPRGQRRARTVAGSFH